MRKSYNRKEVKKRIIELRNAGNPDKEIYDQLTVNYFDKKTIALLIKGTAEDSDIKKYRIYNKILAIAYIIAALVNGVEIVSLKLTVNAELDIPLLILAPVSCLYFAYEINRYDASVYKIGPTLIFLYFVISWRDTSSEIILANAVLFVVIVALSMFLIQRLFPKYNFGKLRKDENGNYVMD